MLKIYLRTVEYYVNNEDKVEYLTTRSDYVIRDEADAVEHIDEFGVYTEQAKRIYGSNCSSKKTKKGMKVVYDTWGSRISVREWSAPNAKLVLRYTFKEDTCSMKYLMTLPAPDVAAYLRQECLNLTITS